MADNARIAYQCFATGEYVGPMKVFHGVLPNGATWDEPPAEKEGYARFYRNGRWEYVEDHRKEEGYVNGERTTIYEVGPLPSGWNTEPPAPTEEELFTMLRAVRDGKLGEYDRRMAQLNRNLRLATDLGKASVEKSIEEWDAYAQALCDIPSLAGAPWDGGGEKTPWPVMPE